MSTGQQPNVEQGLDDTGAQHRGETFCGAGGGLKMGLTARWGRGAYNEV